MAAQDDVCHADSDSDGEDSATMHSLLHQCTLNQCDGEDCAW